MKKLIAALCLVPSLAWGQAAVRQSGSVTNGDMPKWTTSQIIQSAGGLLGDQTGLGTNPFSVTDLLGLGLCFNTAATGSTHHSLCMGHDSNSNPIFSVDNVNYPFLGLGSGNVIGPTSPFPTANNVVIWNGSTLVADSKIMAINSNTTGGGLNGNATILATPPLGLVSSFDHTIGINVVPTFTSANATSDFMGGIEVNLGEIGTPIPAGTKGMPVGIVANVTTNQALADQQAQNNGTAFAATVTVSNGAWFDGLDMDMELSGSNARNVGIAMNINNNQTVGGTAPVQGISLLTQGTRNSDTGIHIFGGANVGGSGLWALGIQTDSPVQISTDETVRPCWLCVITPNLDTRRTAMFYQAVGSPTATQDVVLITAFSGMNSPDFNLLRIEDANGQNPGSGTLEFAVAAGGEITTHLPTSAGGGGLFVCVDSSGNLYKKATCP